MPIDVKITSNVFDFEDFPEDVRQQLPFAQRAALFRLGKLGRTALVEAAPKRLRNPTPFFSKAWRIERVGTKEQPGIRFYIDDSRSRNNPISLYWNTAINGGPGVPQQLVRFFRGGNRFSGRPILRNEYLVPTPALRRNKYGNVPGGRWNAIFTGLKTGRYFWHDGRGGKRRGIYEIIGSRKNRKVIPVLVVARVRQARQGLFVPLREIRPALREFPGILREELSKRVNIAIEKRIAKRRGRGGTR